MYSRFANNYSVGDQPKTVTSPSRYRSVVLNLFAEGAKSRLRGRWGTVGLRGTVVIFGLFKKLKTLNFNISMVI